jgi:hypothetical protein
MACGNMDATDLSADLVQLLLRCVGNEVDKLRPRATATLDALLFACCRIIETEKNEVVRSEMIASTSGNPWGTVVNRPKSDPSSPRLSTQLAKSILPLLWDAAQKTRPTHCRIAAARWSTDLLIKMDVASGTHILCYIAGDSDVTASSIAREGLGLDDELQSNTPEFSELIFTIVSDSVRGTTPDTSRPTYWDFSEKGKAVTVKCLLRSYLNDFHNDEEESVQLFMSLLAKSLCKELGESGSDDLLDASSEALSICLGESNAARAMIISSSLSLGVLDIRDLILSASSSRARRFLANSLANLMVDASLFQSGWMDIVLQSSSSSFDVLKTEPIKPSIEVHGAALLGGVCVKLIRLNSTLISPVGWGFAMKILTRLGDGLVNKDDYIGNVSADSILLCSSGGGAVSLDKK